MRPETEARFRELARRRLTPKMLSELGVAIERPVEASELISLEESQRLRKMLDEQRALVSSPGPILGWRLLVETADESEIRLELGVVQARFPEQPYALFRALSTECGAVALRLSEIIRHASSLSSLDQEDLWAIDMEGRTGLILERFLARPCGVPTPKCYLLAWVISA